jgi:hypothetical protein
LKGKKLSFTRIEAGAMPKARSGASAITLWPQFGNRSKRTRCDGSVGRDNQGETPYVFAAEDERWALDTGQLGEEI